jgi:hypothetical protein
MRGRDDLGRLAPAKHRASGGHRHRLSCPAKGFDTLLKRLSRLTCFKCQGYDRPTLYRTLVS